MLDLCTEISYRRTLFVLSTSTSGKMSRADKSQLLGRPRKARIIKDDGLVGELVAPAKFPPRVLGFEAYPCDFGILVEADTSVVNKLQSPADYCAPELFHNIEPSFASDMWSYMVVFLYLYAGTPIFTGRGFAGRVGSIVRHVGGLPSEWQGRYELMTKKRSRPLGTGKARREMTQMLSVPFWISIGLIYAQRRRRMYCQ